MNTRFRSLTFRDMACHVHFADYADNGRIAIILAHTDGTVVAKATCNMPGRHFAPDEVCIKNYSENEGMLNALVTAGVIHQPHRYVAEAFVTFPVCQLTKEAQDFITHEVILKGAKEK